MKSASKMQTSWPQMDTHIIIARSQHVFQVRDGGRYRPLKKMVEAVELAYVRAVSFDPNKGREMGKGRRERQATDEEFA